MYTKTIEMTAKTWDFWYGLTLRYKEKYGSPNANYRYKSPDGHSLGSWQANQKQLYLSGKLNKNKYEKLFGLGFNFPEFAVYQETDEDFLRGCKATLIYRKNNNRTNVYRNYITSDRFSLGEWRYMIKKIYREGKLPADRIQILNTLNFEWTDAKNENEHFYIGIEETLKYKNKCGDANAPGNFDSQDGFHLGKWQDSQSFLYRKGKLEKDKVELLESVGFKWKQVRLPGT